MFEIKAIGTIMNDFEEPDDLFDAKDRESTIVIDPEYGEGLYKIEENEYLQVLFRFHRSQGYALKGPTFSGTVKGVFASRSPRRPSGIGITAVKLLKRDGNRIRVLGLDALNGSPVLDIKPYAAVMDAAQQAKVEREYFRRNPRRNIVRLIEKGKLENVLLNAGELHGHFCPGLAMGVMAGAYASAEIKELSDGMENLLAIVETDNCFSDGVQYTTGCTFGNNALIYRDYGKTAFTLATRDGKGMRISTRADFRARRKEAMPEFGEYFDKVVKKRGGTEKEREKYKELARGVSFAMLKMEFSVLFQAKKVSVEIPDYAPIHDSFICRQCGESVMSTRAVERAGELLCIPCAKSLDKE